jgi:hypothetical protein
MGRNILCLLTAGPFQYASAVEAVATLTGNSDNKFLYTYPTAISHPEVAQLDWVDVRMHVKDTKPGRIARYVDLRTYVESSVRYARQLGRIDMLIAGDITEPFNAVANAIKPGSVVTLDEGTSTWFSHRERYAALVEGRSLWRRLRTAAKHPLYRRSVEYVRALRAHTVFPDLLLTQCDVRLTHSFSHLKAARSSRSTRSCMVIGTPVTKYGIMQESIYAQLLRSVDRSTSLPVIYRAHRGERGQVANYVPKRWHVEVADGPLEFELLRNPIPSRIVGCLSSALVSCQLLVGDRSDVRQLVPAGHVERVFGGDRYRQVAEIIKRFGVADLAISMESDG